LGALEPGALSLDDLAVLAQIARAASAIRVKRSPDSEDYEALLERARKNPDLMSALGLGDE
jgi:tripartite-type tricarboxylate transporter receptor subunit TctC